MSDKKDEKKTNEEIRKEIEQLEKLIEKVKEQNKQKQRGPKLPIRVNLSAVYSRNFYIHFIISFLINFIAMFILLQWIGHLFVDGPYNDMMLMGIILGFTLFEELFKKYLLKKHMSIVIYSVGTIYLLLNMIYFYIIDYMFFGFRWFISSYHPILFVLTFAVFRFVIKWFYKIVERFLYKRNRR
jgi:hypothetical protein